MEGILVLKRLIIIITNNHMRCGETGASSFGGKCYLVVFTWLISS